MIISDTDGNKNDSTILAKMTKDVTFSITQYFSPKNWIISALLVKDKQLILFCRLACSISFYDLQKSLLLLL